MRGREKIIRPPSAGELRYIRLLAYAYHSERLAHLNRRLPAGEQLPLPRRLMPDLSQLDDADPLSEEFMAGEDKPVEDRSRKSSRAAKWVTLARKLIRRKADPDLFIRSQFSGLKIYDHPPTIDHLAGEKAMDKFESRRELLIENAGLKLRSESNRLTREIHWWVNTAGYPSHQAWDAALSDNSTPLSPLFRYCMARSILQRDRDKVQERERFERVIRTYEVPAALQFARSPHMYLRVWSEIVPRDFKDKAFHIYDQLFGDESSQR